MAQKTIQIADKPTLDETKAILENENYGLEAIKNAIGGGAGGSSLASGLHIENITDSTASGNVSAPSLPYPFYDGSAVVLNGEIHILGSTSSGYRKRHYKFNGTSWENLPDLPYEFHYGSAVVLNNEIYIIGSYSSTYIKYFRKFNGTSWENLPDLPYEFNRGSAVVYRGEVHILSGVGNSKGHYKFNGTSWEEVSTLPYSFYDDSAVVLNDEIHILGSTRHCKFNGASWEEVSTLPYSFQNGSAVVLNGEIHILGGNINDYAKRYHYKFNGISWDRGFTIPYSFYDGSAVVLDDKIHILGSSDTSSIQSHYILGNEYRTIKTLLPKGAHVLLPDNVDIKYVSDNAVITPNNIVEVTETGIIEVLAEFISPDDITTYLTFY